MIDQKYQSKGYGRLAMQELIKRISVDQRHHVLYISFEPENEWAKNLYTSLGFVEDGRMDGDEIVYRLDY